MVFSLFSFSFFPSLPPSLLTALHPNCFLGAPSERESFNYLSAWLFAACLPASFFFSEPWPAALLGLISLDFIPLSSRRCQPLFFPQRDTCTSLVLTPPYSSLECCLMELRLAQASGGGSLTSNRCRGLSWAQPASLSLRLGLTFKRHPRMFLCLSNTK